MATDPNVKLWLYSHPHDIDILALSIPLVKCREYSVNPLKWLAYLGYAIYGAEGRLSTSKCGQEIRNYSADVQPRSYYFISAGKSDLSHSLLSLLTFLDEPRFVDVDAVNERTSNLSNLTDRRADFRQRVIERDGTCVITAEPADLCHACHILPHSNGDDVCS